MHKKKDAAAVALGSKGGKASAKKLTHEQRREKARKAAQAKWAKDETHSAGGERRRSRDQKARELTKREREIAEYAAGGRSNSEIAQHFRIGVNTVKKHVGRALEKLGVSNRTELALLLMNDRNDLIKGPPRLAVMGSLMLEAAKEAYEMAQYLARRGQSSSEAERNKHSE